MKITFLTIIITLLAFFSACKNSRMIEKKQETVLNTVSEKDSVIFSFQLKISQFSIAKSSSSQTEIFVLRDNHLEYNLTVVGSMGRGNQSEKKEKQLSESELKTLREFFTVHFSESETKTIPDNDTPMIEIVLSGKGEKKFQYNFRGPRSTKNPEWIGKSQELSDLLKQMLSK